MLAEATDVDAGARLVHARRPGGEALVLPYDELILAVGMRQSYFGHNEFAAHAPGMKTLDDALEIRRRIYRAFEMAETAANDRERQQWLTFALVGGGPTGVELAGQIREIAGHTLDREFQKIDSARARVLLFEGSDAVLGAFGPALAHRAARTLRGLGVELHLGTKVTDIDARGLTVRDHDGKTTWFGARTVLWTAGVEAPPIAAALARATGAKQDRAGRIAVEPDLTVPGHPEIRVTGDVMSLNRLPGLAEVAMQSGAYAGRMVRHQVEGRTKEPKPFKYLDLGSAAYIARGRAVVKAGPLHLSGFTGWLAWLFIHLAFLTGFRSRLGAVLSWSVAFATSSRRERAFTLPDTDALAAAPPLNRPVLPQPHLLMRGRSPRRTCSAQRSISRARRTNSCRLAS